MKKQWLVAPVALAASLVAGTAMAQVDGRYMTVAPWDEALDRNPTTSNTSPVSNWRLNPTASFNGVENAFNGTARLSFVQGGGSYACSGSLLPGGEYILTAAHCADGVSSMTIRFGLYNNVALETRTAVEYHIHPGWNWVLDDGSDIAVVRLNAPVTNLNTYYLSDTNDVGREILITGYGTTGTGYGASSPGWNDSAYGHYGYNVIDGESSVIFGAWGAGTYTEPTYGVTYVSDFDAWTTVTGSMVPNPGQYNTLGRMAEIRGVDTFSSGLALGAGEALIAGGDSGGGDFVWDANIGAWVLTGVHSWGWNFCGGRITSPTCDYAAGNSSSYGDLMGSVATFSHIEWIESIVGRSVTAPIPEPSTYALMALGLAAIGGMARRRRRG